MFYHTRLSVALLVLLSVASCLESGQSRNADTSPVTVTAGKKGKITTTMSEVKLQGIAFQKRTIDQTIPTEVEFSVINVTTDAVLKWFVNGVDVSSSVRRYVDKPPNPNDNLYSTEIKDSGSLKITLHVRGKYLVPGVYKLSIFSNKGQELATATNYVEAPPMLPLFSKVRKVLDGDRLNLFCEVTGYPLPVSVTWRFAHINPDLMEDPTALTEARDRLQDLSGPPDAYTFRNNAVTNDQLVFENLPRDFNGLYQCSVSNSANEEDTTLVLVNIKDRWAALWPFIGILVEVTLLVAGILLYERHQLRARAIKNEAPAATVPTAATPDTTSPSTKHYAANTVQQNNYVAAAVPHVEVIAENTSQGGAEAGADKTDDLRQRGAPQC